MKKQKKNLALTVDITVFTIIDNESNVLLIKRKNPPFENYWALPGGFVEYNEDIDIAAQRELAEETCVKAPFLFQIGIFGKPNRDPRGRTVSVVYMSVINPSFHQINPKTDAKEARWFTIKSLPPLAFDHAEIMNDSINTLRQKIEIIPLAKELLPQEFNLRDLQKVYEIILDRPIKNNLFDAEIFKTGWIKNIQDLTYCFDINSEFFSRFY